MSQYLLFELLKAAGGKTADIDYYLDLAAFEQVNKF